MLQLRANQGYVTWFTNKLGTRVLFFFFLWGIGPIHENKPWKGHKYKYLKQKQKQLVFTGKRGIFPNVLESHKPSLTALRTWLTANIWISDFSILTQCAHHKKRHIFKLPRQPGVHIRSPAYLYKSQLLFSWGDTSETIFLHHLTWLLLIYFYIEPNCV